MNDTTLNVDAIARLARGGIEIKTFTDARGDVHALVPAGFEMQKIAALEPKLTRIHQRVTMLTEDSFVSYVNRWKGQSTRIFMVDQPQVGFTAVIDYHHPADADQVLNTLPNYKAHVVTFAPRIADEWKIWTKAEAMTQTAFAEFIEERRFDIQTPDAATLLDIVRTFKASRKQDYDSLTYANNGDVKVHYSEETVVAGGRKEVAVPSELTLGIPVFFKGPRFAVHVFMRYNLNSGKLAFAVKVDRPEYVLDEAANDIVARIAENTGIEIYRGSAA